MHMHTHSFMPFSMFSISEIYWATEWYLQISLIIFFSQSKRWIEKRVQTQWASLQFYLCGINSVTLRLFDFILHCTEWASWAVRDSLTWWGVDIWYATKVQREGFKQTHFTRMDVLWERQPFHNWSDRWQYQFH